MNDVPAEAAVNHAPGIYTANAPPTNLRYWNGHEWDARPVAGTAVRSLCFVADIVAVTFLWFILLIPVMLVSPGGTGPQGQISNVTGVLVVFVLPTLAFVLYFALFYRLSGRTLGMMLGGLSLVHVPTGAQRLPWGASFIRALVLGASYICGVTVFVWLIITAASRTKQGPHDLAAHTCVLRTARRARPAAIPPVVTAPAHVEPDITVGSAEPQGSTVVPPPVVDAPAGDSASRSQVVFISHATQDEDRARRLSDALEAQGVGTWLASRDVAVGANYAAEIVRAVSSAQYLLVLLSPSSIESPHVRREVSIAIDRNVPVLPVSTDPTGQFMAELPVDWTYWLSLAQVLRMSDEESTAREIARRIARVS